jgi:hypothetical protein
MTPRALRWPVPLCLGVLLGFLFLFPRSGAETKSGISFVVSPYLDTLVIDLLGERRGTGVEILPPDSPGRPLTAGPEEMEQIRLGESILTIALHRPVPGRWIFRTGHPTRIRILSQHFFLRGTLVEPAGEELLRQNDRISVVYRLLDGEGAPLRELPEYPLSPEITLIRPDGRRDRLALERRLELGTGMFRARQPSDCDLPGRYWTEVVVATRDFAGRTVTVFRDRWSGFSVEPSPPRHKPPEPVSLQMRSEYDREDLSEESPEKTRSAYRVGADHFLMAFGAS